MTTADHDSRITELEASLADLTGPARIAPLWELSEMLTNRCRQGVANSAEVDAAMRYLTELHDLLEPSDQLRILVANSLGDLSSPWGRNTADVDTAVGYFEETLAHRAVPAAVREMNHVKVAVLRVNRVMETLSSQGERHDTGQTPNFTAANASADTERLLADIDAALTHLDAVIEAEPVNRQFHQMAVMIRQSALGLRTLIEMFGAAGSSNSSRLMPMWGPATQSLLANAPGRPGFPQMRDLLPTLSSPAPADSNTASGPQRGRTPHAIAAEMSMLHRQADAIRQASRPDEVLDIAWEAATETTWAADYCVAERRPEDALKLLELGRGLLLHAATNASIPVAAPDTADIAAGLQTGGRQALVYLLAEHLLVVTADGDTVTVAAPELTLVPPEPARWHDWAWQTAIQPLIDHFGPQAQPQRVVLIAPGALGRVSWHAARTRKPDAGYRYACEDLVISYAATAHQWIEAMNRSPSPAGATVVFVANPAKNRDRDTFDTMALRRYVYPRSIGLGHTGEHAAGAGTADEVAAYLRSWENIATSLLHLGCHGHVDADPSKSHLELAAGTTLRMDRLWEQSHNRPPEAPGGLVILTDCTGTVPDDRVDIAFALSSSLLAAGAATVVEAGWPAPTPTPSPLITIFHHLLAGGQIPPADALRQAQLWLLDPDRQIPDGIGGTADPDLANPIHWAGVRHHGR